MHASAKLGGAEQSSNIFTFLCCCIHCIVSKKRDLLNCCSSFLLLRHVDSKETGQPPPLNNYPLAGLRAHAQTGVLLDQRSYQANFTPDSGLPLSNRVRRIER